MQSRRARNENGITVARSLHAGRTLIYSGRYCNYFYYSLLYNEYKTALRQLFCSWQLVNLYCLVVGAYYMYMLYMQST